MPKVQVGDGGYRQAGESLPWQQERGSLVKLAKEHVATARRSFPLRIGHGGTGARAASFRSGTQSVAPVQPVVPPVQAVAVGTATLQPVTPVYDPAHADARNTA
jgi:hypothetical protein